MIRCDGHGVPEILDAILQVFPLDTYVENPVNLMQLMPDDVGKVETPIWDTYKEIVKNTMTAEKLQSEILKDLHSMMKQNSICDHCNRRICNLRKCNAAEGCCSRVEIIIVRIRAI